MSDGGNPAMTCPRCGDSVQARFYGPCEACRAQLRVTMQVAARQLDAVRFEPKMNVVPNQVALKE